LADVFVNQEVRRSKKEGRNFPGGVVVNSSPTTKPSPTIQSIPSDIGEPVGVI
jgi:hypothetical protein